jgi:hypothetical protein
VLSILPPARPCENITSEQSEWSYQGTMKVFVRPSNREYF